MTRRRLILANFDCELRFAEAHCPGPHNRALPKAVQLALSRAALPLSVFGAKDDALWTMGPLPPDACELTLRTGAYPRAGEFDAVLPWGQSDDALALMPDAEVPADDASWQESLWRLRAKPGAAAACNDRRLCLTLDIDEEWILPERSTIDSIEMLDAYIATRALGPGDAWVVKAPFAASGRERVRRHGRRLEGEMRVRTQRLLARYGQMVIEPWMPRVADYGVAGVVGKGADSHRVFPPHQLHSDNSGVFRGIRVADTETESQLGKGFARALSETAHKTASTLYETGYRGPFGIDAFIYEDQSGSRRLQSLCEINARLCFGLVARAQAEKLDLDGYEFTL